MGNLLESNGGTRATLILDHESSSVNLRQQLESSDWRVHVAEHMKEFKRLFQQHRFEVVVVYFNDNSLTEISELETLASHNIITKWVAIIPSDTWLDSHPNILFSHLFYDYHRQPLRYDHLLATIGHAYGMAKLQHQKLRRLKVQHKDDDIIGQSPVTQKLQQRVSVVSKQATPVLINGDSGSGKQFIARLLHKQSKSSHGKLSSINCGATPEHLVSSELFGHEAGSLHAGCELKVGQIQQCNNGTLLLNDVEELPLRVQSSLARFIDNQEFHPIGASNVSISNCRIIATSSNDLRQLVNTKQFRNELYQALTTTTIEVPTLSERHQDINHLAQYFVSQFCEHQEIKRFSQCALDAMQHYHWPGNVRELMNRIRRAIILSEGELISKSHLELPTNNGIQNLTLQDARDKVEKEVVVRTIAQTGYNHSQAAKELGISRTSLYRLISKHQIAL
ncbi:sigma-54-dependent Fis family transcriptional regulator [Kangiella sp. HD9-110m-PIT-SAG07]|nr:sigma-54-dependent Fis family transcriptional regulator [Kangiella sp. HD9-110m-PIT-SAG07]